MIIVLVLVLLLLLVLVLVLVLVFSTSFSQIDPGRWLPRTRRRVVNNKSIPRRTITRPSTIHSISLLRSNALNPDIRHGDG